MTSAALLAGYVQVHAGRGPYFEIIPMVRSQSSTNCGQRVIGNFVGR